MGCCESSEVATEDICRLLYKMMIGKKSSAFDAMLHEVLWRDGRRPDWEMVKKVLTTNIETTSGDWTESLMHYAVRMNDTGFIDIMMNYDPPLHCVNSHGNNIIHTCCISGASRSVFEVLTKDVALPGPLAVANEEGDYPLHLAARNHFGWLVEELLHRQVPLSSRNREGDSALEMLRSAHHRNAISRANVTVGRRKVIKEWWEPQTMDFNYIVELLQNANDRAGVVGPPGVKSPADPPSLGNQHHQSNLSGGYDGITKSSSSGGFGATSGGLLNPNPPPARSGSERVLVTGASGGWSSSSQLLSGTANSTASSKERDNKSGEIRGLTSIGMTASAGVAAVLSHS